jgi:hypothetical protein
MRRAAAKVAIDMGHLGGVDVEDAWEDVPMGDVTATPDVNVDPSHEGGDYFDFLPMAEDSFAR